MKWTFNNHNKRYESECKKFRIENFGKKGGEHYCIRTIEPQSKTWSRQLGQGTLKEMLEKEPEEL